MGAGATKRTAGGFFLEPRDVASVLGPPRRALRSKHVLEGEVSYGNAEELALRSTLPSAIEVRDAVDFRRHVDVGGRWSDPEHAARRTQRRRLRLDPDELERSGADACHIELIGRDEDVDVV